MSDSGVAVEVIALFGDTVLDVRRLGGTPRNTTTRGLMIAGSVMLLGGLGWFLSQTIGQQDAWSTYERMAALAEAAGQPRPEAPASMGAVVAFATALLGMVPLVLAGLRMRDSDAPRYTIGEGTAATLATPPVDLLTPDAFELVRVAPNGGAIVRFGTAMQGDVTVGNRVVPLATWVDMGRTLAEGGAHEMRLPPGARTRLQHGALTFLVTAAPKVPTCVTRFTFDAPFLATCGCTAVGLGGLLLLGLMAAPPAQHFELDDRSSQTRFVGYAHRAPVAPQRPLKPSTEVPTKPAAPAPAAPSPSNQLGTGVAAAASPVRSPVRGPRSRARGGSVRAPGPASASASPFASAAGVMQRGTGPVEAARSAGVMAFVDTSPLANNEYSHAFTPDNDDRAMWEAMANEDPTTKSIAGLGLVGKGRGGGKDALDELAGSKPAPAVDEEEVASSAVVVRVGVGSVRGPRARDAVRTVVVRNARALRRCYADGLAQDDDLAGRVTLTLEIDANGTVERAHVDRGRFKAPAVTDCIAREARSWTFPEVREPDVSKASMPLTLRRP